MDFSYLLELAKANEEKSKSEKSIKFSTKVSNAKKIERCGPRREAIEEHLSKIEKEKKKKEEEFSKKKNELLKLREKDKHSKKRVHTLLTRTKGASKSVLEDAKDIAVAKGETQCDEDDYGYESAMSQQIFNKLQNVYKEIPEDERLKFNKKPKSNIEDIKKRVIDSLKVRQEESLGLRKRKRNKKSKRRSQADEDDGFINDGDCYKKFQPPSDEELEEGNQCSFKDKEKSSHVDKVKKSKKKKRHIDESMKPSKESKYANFKYNHHSSSNHDKEKKKEKTATKDQIQALSFDELMKVAVKKQSETSTTVNPLEEELINIQKRKEEKLKEQRPLTAKERKAVEEEKMHKLRKIWRLSGQNKKSKDIPNSADAGKISNSKPKSDIPDNKNLKSVNVKEKGITNSSSDVSSNKIHNSNDVFKTPRKPLDKSKYFAVPSGTSTNKQKYDQPSTKHAYKSNPLKEISKNTSAPSHKPQMQSSKPLSRPSDSRQEANLASPTKRKSIESDDEYDSELDDFIDDGGDELDYSSEIAKMFKYDKSKYSNVDDDIDDMEVSFSQVQKEEKRSAKIGLMEDLEDMRKEEEERKKKMLRKKIR